MRKIILENLYNRNRDLFFNKVPKKNYKDEFFCGVRDDNNVYELKEEYRHFLKTENLSSFEMLQIIGNNGSAEQLDKAVKNIKTIKSWIKFWSILWLISIFIGLIVLISEM